MKVCNKQGVETEKFLCENVITACINNISGAPAAPGLGPKQAISLGNAWFRCVTEIIRVQVWAPSFPHTSLGIPGNKKEEIQPLQTTYKGLGTLRGFSSSSTGPVEPRLGDMAVPTTPVANRANGQQPKQPTALDGQQI